jgi:predicted RNase H-like nuclease (RuvC/YqgF family)
MNESKQPTISQKLQALRAQHKSLSRKVRKETRKVQELARLREENDRLQMDLVELAQGSQPVIDPVTRERTYYKPLSR